METKTLRSKSLWIETKTFVIATYNWLREMFLLLQLKYRLKYAIKMADVKHYISDKRYFVYPDVRTGGLLVLNNDQIKVQKKRGLIDKKADYLKIRERAFYATATRRYGKDAPTKEEQFEMRKKYIKWQKALSPITNRAKVGIPTKMKKKK